VSKVLTFITKGEKYRY